MNTKHEKSENIETAAKSAAEWLVDYMKNEHGKTIAAGDTIPSEDSLLNMREFMEHLRVNLGKRLITELHGVGGASLRTVKHFPVGILEEFVESSLGLPQNMNMSISPRLVNVVYDTHQKDENGCVTCKIKQEIIHQPEITRLSRQRAIMAPKKHPNISK